MVKSIVLVLCCLPWSSGLAQDPSLGTVEVYRTGKFSVGLPLIVDGQVKLKLSHARKILLHLQAGDHMLESKIGKGLNPVLQIHVSAGETKYTVMDYTFPVFATSLNALHLTLEHTNRPPEGQFREEDLDAKAQRALALLPPYHEAELTSNPVSVGSLTAEEVRQALLQGRHTPRPSMVGLYLEDVGTRFASALSDGQSVSGFSIYVYSAKQWLQLKSALAQHEMRPFSEQDVTPEDRQLLLHVLARPSTPDKLNARNMTAAQNANRVVLEEGASRTIVQPLGLEPATFQVDSALRSAEYRGVVASFPQPDITRPFRVVVIGPSDKKDFEIKDKHLASLK